MAGHAAIWPVFMPVLISRHLPVYCPVAATDDAFKIVQNVPKAVAL
jgi:hypothetical protein